MNISMLSECYEDLLKPAAGTAITAVNLADGAFTSGAAHLFPVPELANVGYEACHVPAVCIYKIPLLTMSYRFVPKQSGRIITSSGILPGNYDVVHTNIEERRIRQSVRLRSIEIPNPAYVAFTTKYKEYGHFIIETLPKLLLIRHLLDLGIRYPILAPLNPPEWVEQFIRLMFTVDELSRVSEFEDETVISVGLMPTLLGTGPFHPLFGQLIEQYLLKNVANTYGCRLMISRLQFRNTKSNDFRILENEAEIQQLAVAAGYAIIEPEEISIADQINAFAAATHVIGEASSALHNTIFGRSGCRVLSFNMVNAMQTHIAALRTQSIDYCLATDGARRTWENVGTVSPNYRIAPRSVTDWIEKADYNPF